MPLQTIFHGINRSPAVEAAANAKFEALRKFDNRIDSCKVTVTQEGHQTMGPFPIRVDVMSSGHDIFANATNHAVMQALSEAFDTVRRSVVHAADRRRTMQR